MRGKGLLPVLFAAALVVGSLTVRAEKRLALAIGIDAYQSLPKLQKAVNDARAMAAVLQELGFTATVAENPTRREMSRKLADLEAMIAAGDMVFFFFADHGVALGSTNYLIAADMPKPGDGEESVVRDEAFAADEIVRRLQGRGARVAFLVLDACRNNPFEQSGVRSIGGTRGLAVPQTHRGVFVLFSAGAGQLPLDRLGERDREPNSVFTRKLVPLLRTPGLSHVDIAKRVQEDVDALAATIGHPQQPAYYDQIVGRVVLKAGDAGPIEPAKEIHGGCPNGVYTRVGAGERCLKQGDSFKDCPTCPEMVVVPAGEFLMGSPGNEEGHRSDEGPQHNVAIAKPFAVGKFEVTFAEWDACVTAGGCTHKPTDQGWGRGRRPVIYVDWNDAKVYVAWLAKTTGSPYRLLSEAEWEYAARGVTVATPQPQFHFGNDEAQLCQYGNHADRSTSYSWKNTKCSDDIGEMTAEVGRYKPNAFGLYDMHGNVWEWVEDCYNATYQNAPTDGSAWTAGNCSSRVVRGGGWVDIPALVRAADRGRGSIIRGSDAGLRVARTIKP
ncbi:MAG: SUMF1/EgtB/PvdO family nonheme iron enzyme [Hyphomicrobiaceae bacterium]